MGVTHLGPIDYYPLGREHPLVNARLGAAQYSEATNEPQSKRQ